LNRRSLDPTPRSGPDRRTTATLLDGALLPRRLHTPDFRLATDSKDPSQPVGLLFTSPNREIRHSVQQGHMDKKVTSTFHCVASEQVLKAYGAGDNRSSLPMPAKRQAPVIVPPCARPCGPTRRQHARDEGRAKPYRRPGRSTVSYRRLTRRVSAIVLNSAGTHATVPRQGQDPTC